MSNAYFLGSATEPAIGKLGGFQAFNRALSVDEMTRMLAAGVNDAQRGASAVPTYVSDFSSGTDGWVASNSGALAVVNSIGGRDNVLRLQTSAADYTRVTTPNLIRTDSYVSIEVYIPSTNGTIVAVRSHGGTGGAMTTHDNREHFVPADKWTKLTFLQSFYGASDRMSFLMIDANGSTTNMTEGDVVYFSSGATVTRAGLTSDYQPGGLQMAPGQWIEVVHGKHGTIPDGMILGDYVPPPEGPEISAVDVVDKDSAVRGLISGRRADLIAKKYRSDDVELGGDEPSDELMPTQTAVQGYVQSQKEEISAGHVLDAVSDELGLISGRRADLIAKKYRSDDVELGGAEPSNELMPTQAAVQEFLQSKMPVYSTRITESGTWVRPPKRSLFLVYMANGGNSGSAYASTAAGSGGSGGAGGAAFMFAVRAEDLPDEVPVVIGAGAPPSVAAVPSNGSAILNGTIGGTTYFNGKGLPNGGTHGWSGWLPTSANLPVSGLFAGNGAQSSSVAGNAVWGGAGGGATSSGSSPVRPPGVSLAGGDGGVSAEEQAPSADVVAGAGEFPAGGGAGARISFGTQGQRAISGRGGDGVIDIWGYE